MPRRTGGNLGKAWCVVGVGLMLMTAGCRAGAPPGLWERPATAAPTGTPPFRLIPFEAETRQVSFQSQDGTWLAGQLDLPPDQSQPPLVVIVHHSGPVDRESYQYLAARLVPAGYAVFRFDKRGTGRSDGVYGCCEDDDALAAYGSAVAQGGYDPERVFIVAQSIGTEILARRFEEFEHVHRPAGVILLSNRLEREAVLAIRAPLHIIVSDSEPNLGAIGEAAVEAHREAYGYGASFYVAPYTEHTLFDISSGPIDWADPIWPEKFSTNAWRSLLGWLESR